MTGDTEGLVAGARGGDDAAYEALFARVASRLLVYVRIRLGPALAARVEPMDVVQETYLQAHRDFHAFRPGDPGAFPRWLFRIADNRLRDLASHFGAEKRRALGEAARGSEVVERLRTEEVGPGTESGAREERQALAEAMAGLEQDEREALLLRFFHGLTLEEVAARLGTSEPSVRRALARGQVKLGGRLRGHAP